MERRSHSGAAGQDLRGNAIHAAARLNVVLPCARCGLSLESLTGWEGPPEAKPGSIILTGRPKSVLTWQNLLARYESKLISITPARWAG